MAKRLPHRPGDLEIVPNDGREVTALPHRPGDLENVI